MDFQNKVKIAVQRVGGPTQVALQIGCSGSAVHAWIRKRKVSDINKARKLAELAGMELREVRPCR